jgi:hypothetical protein
MAEVVAGLYRLICGHSPELPVSVAVLLAGPVVGCVVGGLRRCSWSRAATAVDQRSDGKDRVVTALQILRLPDRSILHDLQVHDTAEYLLQIDPASIVPLRWPTSLRFAVPTLLLALAMLLWPPRTPLVGGVQEWPPIVASAETPEQHDVNRNDRVSTNPDGGQQAGGAQPGNQDQPAPAPDGGEAGEKLASNSAHEKDGGHEESQQVGSDGNAPPQPGDAHESVGQSATRDDGRSPPPRDAVAKATGHETDSSTESGPREPSKAGAPPSPSTNHADTGASESSLPERADSLANSAPAGDSTRRPTPAPKPWDGRLTVNQKLPQRDAESTKSWADALIDSIEQEQSLAERDRRDPGAPSSETADASSDNELFGDPTHLKSQRELQRVGGRIAEDSTLRRQKLTSPEPAPQARRKYRDIDHEYKKQSDAALNREVMPLGHRQIIRRYFELIRPSDSGE